MRWIQNACTVLAIFLTGLGTQARADEIGDIEQELAEELGTFEQDETNFAEALSDDLDPGDELDYVDVCDKGLDGAQCVTPDRLRDLINSALADATARNANLTRMTANLRRAESTGQDLLRDIQVIRGHLILLWYLGLISVNDMNNLARDLSNAETQRNNSNFAAQAARSMGEQGSAAAAAARDAFQRAANLIGTNAQAAANEYNSGVTSNNQSVQLARMALQYIRVASTSDESSRATMRGVARWVIDHGLAP